MIQRKKNKNTKVEEVEIAEEFLEDEQEVVVEKKKKRKKNKPRKKEETDGLSEEAPLTKEEKLRQRAIMELEKEKQRANLKTRKEEKARVRKESGMKPDELIAYRSGKLQKELGVLETMKSSRKLFGDVEIIISLILLFGANMGLYFFISKNLIISSIVGFIGMVYFFTVFVYPDRKLKAYQDDLSSLLEYVMNLSFFLASGENILRALENTAEMSKGQVKEDIELTIRILKERAIIDTEHFLKYKYTTLNQFHHNLNIYYETSGDAKEMFTQIKSAMATEIKKRDELARKRQGNAAGVYSLIGLVFLIALVLRVLVTGLWDIFLSYTAMSQGVLLLTYAAVLLNLKALQKHKTDISVRI